MEVMWSWVELWAKLPGAAMQSKAACGGWAHREAGEEESF
jgi:hypothetical protein